MYLVSSHEPDQPEDGGKLPPIFICVARLIINNDMLHHWQADLQETHAEADGAPTNLFHCSEIPARFRRIYTIFLPSMATSFPDFGWARSNNCAPRHTCQDKGQQLVLAFWGDKAEHVKLHAYDMLVRAPAESEKLMFCHR